MSRVGKKPIPLPDKVTASLAGATITVAGPLGELQRALPAAVTVEVSEREVVIRPGDDERTTRALWGLSRSLVANMVEGVAHGFAKELEIVGVGYKAELQGQVVKFALGYSHPCLFTPPAGITVEVPSPQAVVVKGIDKEMVGQCAAHIRAFRPPEPYKGKGIKYKGERIRRKVRKGALAGAGGP